MNGKLLAAFVFAIGTLVAQDPTSYMSPNVLRVGEKLSCRCGGCRNTVGNCPMLHCEYSDPMRRRIASMQAHGRSDSDIIDTVVREQGVVALSTPPNEGWGLVTLLMPGIAALIGFFIYSAYVKRNRKTPEPVSAADEAVLRRFQDQIDDELSEGQDFPKEHPGKEK
ncbi:MAG TPA: cytochrome c-type biogenesis protein CcmH [Bryobacteraceae bacterium]